MTTVTDRRDNIARMQIGIRSAACRSSPGAGLHRAGAERLSARRNADEPARRRQPALSG